MSSYKRKARIKILDEVNCAIIGLHPDHIEWFYNNFARKADNYFFNPKYKLGVWDGNIRYFKESGKTYVYLLSEIIPIISSLGYQLELIDNRKGNSINVDLVDKHYFSHIINPETGEPIELRYYQVEAVNALLSNGGGVVLAGTGSGKTIINSVLSDVYGKRGLKTITIVPSGDLIKQTKDEFARCQIDVGEYSGNNKDINHQHIVSTWQALQNNPFIIKGFNVVIVDECHGIKGQILTKLLNEYGSDIVYRFGLTGTLPKSETGLMSVRIAVGELVYEISASQLMGEGYLAKMDIDIIQLEENFTKQYIEDMKRDMRVPLPSYRQYKDEYFPEWTQEKSYLQTHIPRLDWIAAYISDKQSQNKGNVFCLVNGIRFGKKLTKKLDNATFVHGKDAQKVRREIYDLFESNNNMAVIATVQVAGVGLNIKRIFNLMYIDIGKSFIRVIQTIGRGLRKADDKDYVKVTDISSDLKYSRRHLSDRVKFYREAEYPNRKKVVSYEEI